MINIMTTGLRKKKKNVTQSWPDILNVSCKNLFIV